MMLASVAFREIHCPPGRGCPETPILRPPSSGGLILMDATSKERGLTAVWAKPTAQTTNENPVATTVACRERKTCVPVIMPIFHPRVRLRPVPNAGPLAHRSRPATARLVVVIVGVTGGDEYVLALSRLQACFTARNPVVAVRIGSQRLERQRVRRPHKDRQLELSFHHSLSCLRLCVSGARRLRDAIAVLLAVVRRGAACHPFPLAPLS